MRGTPWARRTRSPACGTTVPRGSSLPDLGTSAEQRVAVLDLEVDVPRERQERAENEGGRRGRGDTTATVATRNDDRDDERERGHGVDPQPDGAHELCGAEGEAEQEPRDDAPATRVQQPDEQKERHGGQ